MAIVDQTAAMQVGVRAHVLCCACVLNVVGYVLNKIINAIPSLTPASTSGLSAQAGEGASCMQAAAHRCRTRQGLSNAQPAPATTQAKPSEPPHLICRLMCPHAGGRRQQRRAAANCRRTCQGHQHGGRTAGGWGGGSCCVSNERARRACCLRGSGAVRHCARLAS